MGPYIVNTGIIIIALLTLTNMDYKTKDDKLLIGMGFFSYFILSDFNLWVVLIIFVLYAMIMLYKLLK